MSSILRDRTSEGFFFFFFLGGGNWIAGGFVKFGAAASRTTHSHRDRGDRSHEIFRVLNSLSAK